MRGLNEDVKVEVGDDVGVVQIKEDGLFSSHESSTDLTEKRCPDVLPPNHR